MATLFDNRGQTGGFYILVYGVIAVVILFTVLTTGMGVASNVAESVNESDFEQAANNTTTVCSATTIGCGTSPVVSVWPAAVLTVILAVIIGGIRTVAASGPGSTRPDATGNSDGFDGVEKVKQQYVNGEIQTTVKLEQDLEDYLDPVVDDPAIDELDDLLHNGNDTDEHD